MVRGGGASRTRQQQRADGGGGGGGRQAGMIRVWEMGKLILTSFDSNSIRLGITDNAAQGLGTCRG